MVGLAVAALAAGCISSPTEPQDQAAEPTSVVITPEQLTTTGGMPDRFTAEVLDASGTTLSGTSVDWSTSSPSVAVVDRDGLVWSFAEGTAMASAAFPGRGNSSPNGNAYGHSKKDAEIAVTAVAPDRPAQVTDLAVASTTTSSATLSFTEVGDGTGSPADYVVRFQVGSMDWGTATDVSSGTCSVPLKGNSTGSKVSCTVTNLDADTNYKFQLVAFRGSYPSDMVYGDLSNVASASTPAPPDPTAQPQPGNVGHPNQPADLTPIASISFSDSINAEVGVCEESNDPWKQSNMAFDVTDSTAPTGDGKVFRGKSPGGMHDGISPWRFNCWGPTISQTGDAQHYDEIYISVWMKIEGTDYENQQDVGSKIFYWSSGDVTKANDHALFLDNFASEQTSTSMPIVARLSSIDDNGFDTSGLKMPQASYTPRFTVGSWHQIEVYAKINDINPTVDNGKLRVWLDGGLLVSNDSWRYRSDVREVVDNSFSYFQFTPVWGGNAGDVRTRDDYWRIDEVYIAGKI